jgi:transcriptional regulator with XRE-family HTH domain
VKYIDLSVKCDILVVIGGRINMNYEEHIGENIKSVRVSQGLSQQAVADLCGFSNTILSQYENGKKTPNLVTTAKIAKALKVSIDRLYYGDENNAFITSESDDGRKIVNSIYLLWSKGVITYYENYSYGYNPMMIAMQEYGEEIEKNGIYLFIREYHNPIRRLINSLNEFEQRKDTYPDPEAYLDMLFSSVAAEINKEIEDMKLEQKKLEENRQKGQNLKKSNDQCCFIVEFLKLCYPRLAALIIIFYQNKHYSVENQSKSNNLSSHEMLFHEFVKSKSYNRSRHTCCNNLIPKLKGLLFFFLAFE